MKCFFKGIVVCGVITGACWGDLTIEDTSSGDRFGCTLELGFSDNICAFIKRKINETSEPSGEYNVDDFITYQDRDREIASKFLLDANRTKHQFVFDDIKKTVSFLKNLKEVINFYWREYEAAYNRSNLCSIGKWVGLECYILQIDEILPLLTE